MTTENKPAQAEYVNVTINGVEVANLKVMDSPYPGFCDYHRKKYPAGQKIAFRHKNSLTTVQKKAIFGDRDPFNLTVIWPLQRQDSVPSNAPAAVKKSKFTPNEYQTTIREKLFGTAKHIFVRALAGCTKTSTALWLCEELGLAGATKGKNCAYLAFNTSIKDEVRVPLTGTGVRGYTTHGFMLNKLLKKAFPALDLDNAINEYRSNDLFLRALCDDAGYSFSDSAKREVRQRPEFRMMAGVVELVGLLKNWAVLPTPGPKGWEFSEEQRERVKDLIAEYSVVVEPPYSVDDYTDMALRVAKMSLPAPGESVVELDFDDMLWLPLALNLPFPKMNLVITDESQDFNGCQVLILHKLIVEGARVVVIGDEFQALYRFRGGDCRAFDRILDMLKTTQRGVEECVLPLNYRCARAIIQNANRWVPALMGFRQDEGQVDLNASFATAVDQMMIMGGTTAAVLSRVNAPLVIAAYYVMSKMIQEKPAADRKAVCILGKKTAAAPLKSLIRDLCRDTDAHRGTSRISDRTDHFGRVVEEGFLTRLAAYRQTQVAKLGGNKRYAMRLEEILNNCTCLQVIAATVKDDNVGTMVDQIDSLFVEKVDDPKKTIVFSTVHRSKGLEWDKVWIIRPDLLPHPNAQPNEDGSWSDEQQQEENASYVAATRARDYLGYVGDWPGTPPQEQGSTSSGDVGMLSLLRGVVKSAVDPLAAVPDTGMVWTPPSVRSDGPTRRAVPDYADESREDWSEENDELRAEQEFEERLMREPYLPPKSYQPVPTPVVPLPAPKPLPMPASGPRKFVDDGEPF